MNQQKCTFFIKDLIQLYCLQHVSTNQAFILRKTCTYSFMVFFMHMYKQSGQYQDVFDTHDIDHKTACTSLPEDEHLVI